MADWFSSLTRDSHGKRCVAQPKLWFKVYDLQKMITLVLWIRGLLMCILEMSKVSQDGLLTITNVHDETVLFSSDLWNSTVKRKEGGGREECVKGCKALRSKYFRIFEFEIFFFFLENSVLGIEINFDSFEHSSNIEVVEHAARVNSHMISIFGRLV